jgi:hypothetical protein
MNEGNDAKELERVDLERRYFFSFVPLPQHTVYGSNVPLSFSAVAFKALLHRML